MLRLINNVPLIISLPIKPFYHFADGTHLAQTYIKPIERAIATGPQAIIISIPDEVPVYSKGHAGKTISAVFFTGLLQDLLIALRDANFPQLKHEGPRRKIHSVAGTEQPEATLTDILSNSLGSTEAYNRLEESIKQRVSLSLSHADGTTTDAADMKTENGRTLLHWSINFTKGLMIAFMNDLNYYPNNPKYPPHAQPASPAVP